MTVLNADGSQPEMCGNGLRCVALHLSRHRHAGRDFTVETDSGMLDCRVQRRGEDDWVDLSLGRAAVLEPISAEHDGTAYHFHRISMGNPHAVTFDAQPSIELIDRFAPQVSARLPNGTNVEFVRQLAPTELDVIVWERGVGRTLACGTGAGAVTVAAAIDQRVPFGQKVLVNLAGGPLEITVGQADLDVRMCGPAKQVFEGSLTPP
jgi:diaminopimelate epimerase